MRTFIFTFKVALLRNHVVWIEFHEEFSRHSRNLTKNLLKTKLKGLKKRRRGSCTSKNFCACHQKVSPTFLPMWWGSWPGEVIRSSFFLSFFHGYLNSNKKEQRTRKGEVLLFNLDVTLQHLYSSKVIFRFSHALFTVFSLYWKRKRVERKCLSFPLELKSYDPGYG